ncbi:MAG TPA: hypothetical protein VFV02_12930 [Acidimicrobiales bacterium]|nr:hypothetical protein [Acidimicrobiales bacterium]
MEPDVFSEGDRLVAAFARWAAQERTAQAAGMRSRERSLRDQAAGEATWSGLLVDLAETRSELAMEVGTRRIRGTLVGVGQDFCVLDQEGRRPVLIPIERIAAVWKENPASGSRFPDLELTFGAALAGLADERAPVRVILGGGSPVIGELIGFGTDLVTIRTDSSTRRTVHVRISQIEVCELR